MRVITIVNTIARMSIRHIPSHILERHIAPHMSTKNIHRMGVAGVHGIEHVATERVQSARKRASRAVEILGSKIADAIRTARAVPFVRTAITVGTLKISIEHKVYPASLSGSTPSSSTTSVSVRSERGIIEGAYIRGKTMTVYTQTDYDDENRKRRAETKSRRILTTAALRHAAKLLKLHFVVGE